MSVPPGGMPPQGPPQGPPMPVQAPPQPPPGMMPPGQPLPPSMMPKPLPPGPSGKGTKQQTKLAQDVNVPPAKTAYDPNPWPERLNQWANFSRKSFESGKKIEMRYEDDRDGMAQMENTTATGVKKVNLFYSNVTILKESLYNSLPKPDVSRLHKGDYDNEPARVAAEIMERALSYEVQCAPSFDTAVKAAILDRLVPGIGTLWLTFVPAAGETMEYMTIDLVYWQDLVYEPRRAWEQCGWVGRKLYLDEKVAKARWGDKVTALPAKSGLDRIKAVNDMVDKDRVVVIQMWDRDNKKLVHLSAAGDVLDENDDPYKLKDFYPTPKPLIANPPTRKFLPLSDYYMAQDQYGECDILYARINLIIEAVKVAGVYDSSVTEISRMLSGSENTLIPVDNWAMFADKGGVKGVIDWYPVETVTQVLQQLVTTFTFLKQELFEVTGMADIIRGASNQYETAAAQQIKAQFASVRMTAFQRDVAFFVRDTLRIMADLISQLYSNTKLAKIVGNLPDPDMLQLGPALAILRDQFITSYSIDIESDSLTQADWAMQQQQRLAYVQALAQFLQQALPVAQQIPSLAPMLLTMIKFASVGFRGSTELEGVIDASLTQLTQQANQGGGGPQKPPSKQEIQAQAAQQQAQQQQQQTQQQMEAAAQKHAQQMQFDQEEHAQQMQMDAEKHAADMQYLQEKNSQKLIDSATSNAQDLHQSAIGFSQEMANANRRADTDIQIASDKAAAQANAGAGGE